MKALIPCLTTDGSISHENQERHLLYIWKMLIASIHLSMLGTHWFRDWSGFHENIHSCSTILSSGAILAILSCYYIYWAIILTWFYPGHNLYSGLCLNVFFLPKIKPPRSTWSCMPAGDLWGGGDNWEEYGKICNTSGMDPQGGGRLPVAWH